MATDTQERKDKGESSMGNVKRVYVEKKEPFAVKAKELKEEIGSYLGIGGVQDVRVFIRYDVENISDEVFAAACRTVFSNEGFPGFLAFHLSQTPDGTAPLSYPLP